MGSLTKTCLLLCVAVLGASAAPGAFDLEVTTRNINLANSIPIDSDVPLLDGKIVGGTAGTIEDYPYQLSMRVNGAHICGASIISTIWAVTAAHCSGSAASSMTLKAGSSDRTTGGTIHSVVLKIKHRQYVSRTQDYDIALLKVKTPFVYGPTIKNVALPAQGTAVPAGLLASVSGWGTLTSGSSTLPAALQAVQVPIVNQTSCKASYGTTAITLRMICAGVAAGGKDTCQGDSGGPMVATLGGVVQLVGVTSWGYGCAAPNYPGVYARVPELRSWIKTNSGV